MPSALQRAVGGFERLGRPAAWTLALGGVLLLGWLDFVSGFEVSFSLFYLVPVAFAAWRLGRGAAGAVSVASAAAWLLSNRLAGEVHSSSLIPLWNMGTRLGFFLLVTELLTRLRSAFEELRELTRRDFLPGTLNGRGFFEAAAAECERLRRFLERLREALRASMQRGGWGVTVSVGALTCDGEPPGVDELVRRADDLMYEVKGAGKDAIRYATFSGPGDPGRAA